MLNGKLVLVRPKQALANGGNYFETRWFTAFPGGGGNLEEFILPSEITCITGQTRVPFGDAILVTSDGISIGFEVCEEFFTSLPLHSWLAREGVEIISNGSASHFEAGKHRNKLHLMEVAGQRVGGVYIYSNAMGCDGDRAFYDGDGMIFVNGRLVAANERFSLRDVVVDSATINIDQVNNYRSNLPSASDGTMKRRYYRIYLGIRVGDPDSLTVVAASSSRLASLEHSGSISKVEETANAAAIWMFDYLERSVGPTGAFFLPLSGGADSGLAAMLTYHMAQLLFAHYGHQELGTDSKRIVAFLKDKCSDGPLQNLTIGTMMNNLLATAYISAEFSSEASRGRAAKLASVIASNHIELGIDHLVMDLSSTIQAKLDSQGVCPPSHSKEAAITDAAKVANQNIRARLRMVMSYGISQMMPDNRPRLILSAANASECLLGYFTKYDCSSADLNPIGSLSKHQINEMISFFGSKYEKLREIADELLEAIPSAELGPDQQDEVEMGISYPDISKINSLRLVDRLGQKTIGDIDEASLVPDEPAAGEPNALKAGVSKEFYNKYLRNRHKTATLPPSCHLTRTNPDDNRFDMRPLFYPN